MKERMVNLGPICDRSMEPDVGASENRYQVRQEHGTNATRACHEYIATRQNGTHILNRPSKEEKERLARLTRRHPYLGGCQVPRDNGSRTPWSGILMEECSLGSHLAEGVCNMGQTQMKFGRRLGPRGRPPCAKLSCRQYPVMLGLW